MLTPSSDACPAFRTSPKHLLLRNWIFRGIGSGSGLPDTWLALELIEGKNRQVRRMTAAVGRPTLRLLRARTGDFPPLGDLAPGNRRELTAAERTAIFA